MNTRNEVGATKSASEKRKAKGRKLRQSQWWKEKISKGVCHYCGGEFTPDKFDDGSHSTHGPRRGKVPKVTLCHPVKNVTRLKKYYTSAEIILRDKMGKDIEF